ncbi:hypothetical protein H6G76_31385 [Nostoc sp. FACHB-152]|uniref:opioid growth factor receptor-related protein n=1 Tax=Nostoc sp. FACHB-152 TaxID=2692837 RepID=UPI001686C62F|nr:opioid growth factor receptor-related protein [Nostoc sp. FACHB-152]MBD2451543.1 hypothetical protein [Nostoc sp. FACHB-152]
MNFYAGTGIDRQGRKIEDVWSWNYEKLEDVHDFIQWIFPLPELSIYNPNAPVLTVEDISYFKSSEKLKDRLLKSLDLMLDFYGFVRLEDKGNVKIIKNLNYDNRIQKWVTPNNHNFLRITRILRSITLLGLSVYAAKFFGALEELYLEKQNTIGSVSFQYWKAAIYLDT